MFQALRLRVTATRFLSLSSLKRYITSKLPALLFTRSSTMASLEQSLAEFQLDQASQFPKPAATPTPEVASTPKPAASGCKVVLANSIAAKLLAEVQESLKTIDHTPALVGFLANDDPAAVQYAEYSAKTCKENGFFFNLKIVDKEIIEAAILEANHDPHVDGIIVYYPIFPAASHRDQYIQQLVSADKDVEGLCHEYVFNMYQNIRHLKPGQFRQEEMKKRKSILPCTPLACVKVLEHLQVYNPILTIGNRLHGKTITVINRSEVVGRPLAALLANDGARVFSIDIDGVQLYSRGRGLMYRKHEVQDCTKTLDECLYLSDVVISGVPSAAYKVDATKLRDGAVCVNFSSHKNFDTAQVKEHASIYVPAIGKVTIAVLLRNLITLIKNSRFHTEPTDPTA